MHFLHTMVRVLDEEASLRFFVEGLGLQVDARREFPQGRFTLIFLSTGAPGDKAQIELTVNWDQTEPYTGGRNFGHVAFAVDDIYAKCTHLQAMGYMRLSTTYHLKTPNSHLRQA